MVKGVTSLNIMVKTETGTRCKTRVTCGGERHYPPVLAMLRSVCFSKAAIEHWPQYYHIYKFNKTSVFEGTKVWKEVRKAERREAIVRRKEPAQAAPTGFSCHICRRPCKGNAGLQAHLRLGH